MEIKITSKDELDMLQTMFDFLNGKKAFVFGALETHNEVWFPILMVAENKLCYLFKKENKVYMSKTVSYKCDISISSDAAPKLIKIWNDICHTCKEYDFMIDAKLASET